LISGGLFTRDWLCEGVRETPEWLALTAQTVGDARIAMKACLDDLLARRNPVEAETETKLVWPVLGTLGWQYISVQQNMSVRGRSDVPDALLFADADSDAAASGLEAWQRFRHGAALVEAKRWNRPLDRTESGEQGVPSTQLMHYLNRAEAVSARRLSWGMLTNGRHWRLYWQNAQSVADDYFEVDLGKVFALPGCEAELFDEEIDADHALRLFLLLFGRDAFIASEAGTTFHARALNAGKQWEARVARDLSDVVFDKVFPLLVTALPRHDPERPVEIDAAYVEAVRASALMLLYRLLFILYAEDRNLLPDERGPYAEYALTRLRNDIAERKADKRDFLESSRTIWARLETIFDAIAMGNDELGIPPYNGGLFDGANAPLLARVRLPDTVIGEVVWLLSHRPAMQRPAYINYRDLTVQQLGSIYESILEYAVEPDGDGGVQPKSDNTARHRSGSYYTPEDLVALIIERAVGPLVAERTQAFIDAVAAGTTGASLQALDPASRILDLKIVDPAMGSGHFLVSLVDWLSDRVLAAIADAEKEATGYTSPLLARISALRDDILTRAAERGWPIVAEQLDTPHIVRRMVLKRCVYGVDLNPMAVELAKVALWLHSFTVGAPLSFLDHHLRCGNSVLGAWVRPTTLWLANRGALMINPHLARIDNIARTMEQIETINDNDIGQVEESKALFGTVSEAAAPLDALFSMIEADALMGVFADAPARIRETAEQIERVGRKTVAQMADTTDAEKALKAAALAKVEKALAKASEAERRFTRAEAFKMVLEGSFGDPTAIAAGTIVINADNARGETAAELVGEARNLTAEHRYFNWEIAFPGVWANLQSEGRSGGFDAVIGNPPYVRQEMISAIKPALQRGYASYAGTADLYVYFYEQGLKLLRPGGRMAYVVTNKWLKAGYAEGLRRMFADDAWVEFMADFGHAKRFFPDADVFPCVIAVRKPDPAIVAPDEFDLSVIPRDDVPQEKLSEAVTAASYRARRDTLTAEPWTLEPPDVAALLAKIRANGVPLVDYAGVKPLYGIKTGFNEAFLIDTATKERLIRDDPRAAEIIKPYLRGQDIDRWVPDWAGLWMIFARRGIEIENYPSVLAHLTTFRSGLEPKPDDWRPSKAGDEWPGRKGGTYQWYEIQDPVDYHAQFNRPKIVLRRIAFYAQISVDHGAYYVNDSALILPSTDAWTAACLNSPAIWTLMFKQFPHKKDEALALDIPYVECLPVPVLPAVDHNLAGETVERLTAATSDIRTADCTLADWLTVEIGLAKLPTLLTAPSKLDSDSFVAAVRAAMPRRASLAPQKLKDLRDAFADIAEPARAARTTALANERTLSDIVNRAYGLTPEDIALMWRTAPPRMPVPPPIV
jgi:hypothetical protein